MRKIALNIALLLIIILMSLPYLQMRLHLAKEKPLHGAFILADKPKFNRDSWNSGIFQDQTEKYLKDHIGFRSFLVRLQNQLDFTLFRKANAEGAIVGKNGQLFEYDYIRSWLAIDFPGESFLTRKLNRTKYVQDYLKRELGIDLVVVFEPGKASFFPEYIPDRFVRQKRGPSNYDLFIEKATALGVDFIDMQAYFMELKPGSEYPLFPRQGTHWSVYGMKFAADSLIKFIEQKRQLALPQYRIDSMPVSSDPWDTDDDVLKTMNLLLPLKGERLAYPRYGFDSLTSGDKPMVLVVADSYYWNIYNTRLPKNLFANEAFWYFNALVYPDYYGKPKYTHELNLKEEVEKQDIIFLMVTERFLHKFDWMFIDQLYSMYTPEWLKDPVYDNINNIMRNDAWYNDIIEKASRSGLSLEEALQVEGRYMLYRNDTVSFLIQYGPEHYSRIIAGEPGWMRHIREKAAAGNTTVEEALMKDALYIFNHDYPALYEINLAIEDIKERINTDPWLKDTILREASRYHFDPSAFIQIEAALIFKEEEIARISHAIRNDANWLEHVRQKAEKKGILLEEMIRMDAEYVFGGKMK